MNRPFNEAKYNALLEGLEVSEVSFSKIDLGDRFDSEFFRKENLVIENSIKRKNYKEFRELGDFVASAFYPAATHLYNVGEVPFIRCVDCIDYLLITKRQNDTFEKIPINFVQNNSGVNTLERFDIVITKVGTPGYSSMIYEHKNVALSRTVLGIKNINKINNFYLLIFLRSKYGFNQLQRHRELTIQFQLTLERVKRVLIFKPSESFQSKIENVCRRVIKKTSESKGL